MAKLTYWIAECIDDHVCYSIVDKTKHGCKKKLEERGRPQGYLPAAKRTIVYKDAFDLMEQLTSEDGGRGYSNS